MNKHEIDYKLNALLNLTELAAQAEEFQEYLDLRYIDLMSQVAAIDNQSKVDIVFKVLSKCKLASVQELLTNGVLSLFSRAHG